MRTRAHQLSASLNEAVDRTVAVLSRTQEGEELDWQIELVPDLKVDIDRHDLMELVGVILENAAKWGKSQVRVAARRDGEFAELTIADDGPGLTEEQIARLGVRGNDDREAGKGPVADHGDQDRGVMVREMFRDAVLRRKDREGQKREEIAGSLGFHHSSRLCGREDFPMRLSRRQAQGRRRTDRYCRPEFSGIGDQSASD